MTPVPWYLAVIGFESSHVKRGCCRKQCASAKFEVDRCSWGISINGYIGSIGEGSHEVSRNSSFCWGSKRAIREIMLQTAFKPRIEFYWFMAYTRNYIEFLWIISWSLPFWNLEFFSLLSLLVFFLLYFYLFSFQHPASRFSAINYACTSIFIH